MRTNDLVPLRVQVRKRSPSPTRIEDVSVFYYSREVVKTFGALFVVRASHIQPCRNESGRRVPGDLLREMSVRGSGMITEAIRLSGSRFCRSSFCLLRGEAVSKRA